MSHRLAFMNKALVAAAGVIAVAVDVLADGHVSQAEAGALVIAVLTAFGVYQVRNAPQPPQPPA